MAPINTGGRPRSPEDALTDLERRKRERWRAYSAARYAAQQPQRDAQRLAREVLKAERLAASRTKVSPSSKRRADHKSARQRPAAIPSTDKRPW